MSHFVVLVRLPSKLELEEVGAAVDAALAPFQENNMGDCPEQYLTEFHECEEESHDDCGHTAVDPKTGKYGYWENPNKKWDWHVIGGRWRGYFTPKAGKGTGLAGLRGSALTAEDGDEVPGDDVIRIVDIDIADAWAQADKRLEKVWSDFELERTAAIAGLPSSLKGWDSYNARDSFLNYGLIECRLESRLDEDGGEPSEGFRKVRQNRSDGIVGYDYWSTIEKAAFLDRARMQAFGIRPYAFLDSHHPAPDNWHEPGRMGWWGHSSATHSSKAEFSKAFLDWLGSGDLRDWLVAVDCHI